MQIESGRSSACGLAHKDVLMEASCAVQPAVEAIAAELQDEARVQRLTGAHGGWARLLALLLAAAAQLPGEPSLQPLPADWQPLLLEALAEALR